MQHNPDILASAVAAKAKALFASKEMLCADAIMSAVNEGLGGGLDPDMAKSLAGAYGEGLGGAGCLCGAVNGAALSLALILSKGLAPAQVRKAGRELHDRFKERHGSTCCRVLTKKVKANPKEHFTQCAGLTESGARMAVSIILERMPELAAGANPQALTKRRSVLGTILRRLADKLG